MEEENGRERITEAIEIFIEQYCPENGSVELKAGEIRKWPILKSVFKTDNKYPKDICNAMDKVDYEHELVSGEFGSTSYTLKYINKMEK